MDCKFSDTEFVPEDEEQDLPEDQTVISKSRSNTSYGREEDMDQPITTTLRPKKSEPAASKTGAEENICTPIFLYQLCIILLCVVVMNYFQVSYLNKSVHMNKELAELKDTLTKAEKLHGEYVDKVGQLDEINQKLEKMQPYIFHKGNFTMAFMILLVIVLGLSAAVFCLYQRQHNRTDRIPDGLTLKRLDDMYNKDIRKGPGLEPGVCIISFDESRTPEHRRILDSANVPNCKVEVCVIRRHEHIRNLPRCKVYLMCTEFSERHVIIEEPGKGLGDLHRTTYYAVKALGGCLIILYTKDPVSKNLSEDTLYNTNIYCATHQPELSELNNDGRFFSVYNNLTQHQKTELRNKIIKHMK